MCTVVSYVRIGHLHLPVMRGIRMNLLIVRRARIRAERSSVFITGTNCCTLDYSTVGQCKL